MNDGIRKQVDKLRAEDFDAHPCWEYALGEEGRKGQDECTVRPLDPARLGAEDGPVLVQAVFFFPNGRVRLGAITLRAGDDASGHAPIVFLGKKGKHLHFYDGGLEPGKARLRDFRRALEKVSPAPFPIRYVSSLLHPDGRPLAHGELRGLYWLKDWRTHEMRVAG